MSELTVLENPFRLYQFGVSTLMLEFLFGRFLKFHIESLRQALGSGDFARLMRDEGINERSIAKLESGAWRTIDHHSLFVLMCAATAKGVFPLVEIVDGPFWDTFRANKNGFALVGVDLNDNHVSEDIEAASTLIRGGLSLQIVTVRKGQNPDDVKSWIREKNLLVVGGSKVNRATEICLCELWKRLGGPPIRFLWPGYSSETVTAGPSPNANRILEVREHGRLERLEEDGRGRRLGIVVVCREPFGAVGVSTIVIAGCSREATRMMVADLQRPDIYYHYRPEWKHEKVGEPILFLFDSHGKAGRWRVVGFQKAQRRPGRKPGSRPRRMN